MIFIAFSHAEKLLLKATTFITFFHTMFIYTARILCTFAKVGTKNVCNFNVHSCTMLGKYNKKTFDLCFEVKSNVDMKCLVQYAQHVNIAFHRDMCNKS